MREILFRGKRKDNGKWCYGSLQCFKGLSIFDNNYKSFFTVNSTTVGQYTGLTDKNGTKIFEGDILEGMHGLYRVYFDTSLACYEWARIDGNWGENFSGFADEYEVIGNVYDNPELLKGGEG